MENKKFYSRQNDVYLKGGKVYKKMSDDNKAYFETETLKKLKKKNVPVPEIFYLKDNEICMEYIEGTLLIDKLLILSEKEDVNRLNDLAADLYSWFKKFYKNYPDKIRGDINARNYICTDTEIIGIDFEDVKEGAKEKDLGKMIAFFITYDPVCDERRIPFIKKLLELFINGFNLDRNKIINEFERELSKMEKRRIDFKIDKKKVKAIVFD